MEALAVFVLLHVGAFFLTGIVCFIWNLRAILKIKADQASMFSMLSSLMQEMSALTKSVETDLMQSTSPTDEAKIPPSETKTASLPVGHPPADGKPASAAVSAAKPADSARPKPETPKKQPKPTVSKPAEPIAPSVKPTVDPKRTEATNAESKQQYETHAPKQTPPPLPTPKPLHASRPTPEKSGNPFERKAGEILGKIWNWIVVGEEFRNPDMALEYAVASVWLLRVAIVILVLGGVFFVNYSIEKGWLGPVARVSGIFASGLLMLGAGVKLANKKYHLIAQGLLGGGLAMLYVGVFAGFAKFKIIEASPGFALMIVVTVAAGVLAVRLDSLLVAVLGVVGGYMTPVLINTVGANLPGLYAYMLVLGVCVLGIAKYRDWKLLNSLAFLFTYALFLASLDKGYHSRDFQVVVAFLSLFFVLFSFIPILHNLLNKQKATILELLFMTLNATVYFASAYGLIVDSYDKRFVAVVTVALAAFYVAQIHFFAVRKHRDRNFLIALAGFASFFITFTVPMLLSDTWITTAWAVEALVFMWMSVKMGSNLVRVVAYLLYLLAFARLATHDLHSGFLDASSSAYWSGMLDRFATLGAMIISLAGSFRLLKRERINAEAKDGIYAIAMSSNDIPAPVMDSTAAKVMFWTAFAFLFGYLQFEAHALCGAYYPPLRLTIVSLVWLAAMLYLLAKRSELGGGVWRLLTLLMALYLGKLLFFDLPFWDFSFSRFVYLGDYNYEDGLMRLLDFVPSVLFFAFAALVFQRTSEKKEVSGSLSLDQVFGAASVILLFLYATFELNSFLAWEAPGFRAGGISILWSVFAIAFILSGILKHQRVFRYSGLALFVVVVAKVFLSDLARLDQLYRIVAFIALGLIILGAAFIYVKFKTAFENKTEETS